MNTLLLKSVMALNNDTGSTLAEYLGISKGTLSQKINGKTEFTRSEIEMIVERYSLDNDKLCDIFFAKQCS